MLVNFTPPAGGAGVSTTDPCVAANGAVHCVARLAAAPQPLRATILVHLLTPQLANCVLCEPQIYVLLPMVLYIAERTWRLLRNVAFHGELLDVELLPGGRGGGVTVLRMKRPRDFSYRWDELLERDSSEEGDQLGR